MNILISLNDNLTEEESAKILATHIFAAVQSRKVIDHLIYFLCHELVCPGSLKRHDE